MRLPSKPQPKAFALFKGRGAELSPEPIGVEFMSDFSDVRNLLFRHLVVGAIIWLRENSVLDQGGKDRAGDYGSHP